MTSLAPLPQIIMTKRIVVTGTDTGIGKTVFSAGLAGLLDGFYWKPVQSGLDEETDSEVVARLSGLPAGRVLPEVYRLRMPLSPHRSAEIDGVSIEAADLSVPAVPGPLIIEGAGGVMVPLNRRTRFIDIFAQWQLPVILCARTALGTINHTLLSIEALRARSIPLIGIAFIGEEVAETQSTIVEFGGMALANAGIDRSDIGLLLLATSTPDHLLPPSAPLVGHRLGLGRAGAIDLTGACAGFIYALMFADGFTRLHV